MMTRLFLLLVLGFVVAMYFPRSRAVILDKGKPIVDPILTMQTEREMNRIGTDLIIYQRENFGRLPGTRQFSTWVEDQYSGNGGLDAWGNPYDYRLKRDEFDLTSYGPDGLRATVDDITVTRQRTNR